MDRRSNWQLIVLGLMLLQCGCLSKATEIYQSENFVSPWDEDYKLTTNCKLTKKGPWLYYFFTFEDEELMTDSSSSDEEENAVRSDRVELFFSTDSIMTNYYTAEIDIAERMFDAKAKYLPEQRPAAKIDQSWDWPDGAIDGFLSYDKPYYSMGGRIKINDIDSLGLLNNNCFYLGMMRADYKYDKSVTWLTAKDPKTAKPNFHNPGVLNKICF